MKTIMAAILKGCSKPKFSQLATSKDPSERLILKATTDGHFPYSYDSLHKDGASVWARDDDTKGHFKKQLFGTLHGFSVNTNM